MFKAQFKELEGKLNIFFSFKKKISLTNFMFMGCTPEKKKAKSFHLCSPLHLHSLVLKSSRSMWDCCLLTRPSIRLNVSPPTHHFDCPTCWKREPERKQRGQGGIKKRCEYKRDRFKGYCHACNAELDFITTKIDKNKSCSNYIKKKKSSKHDSDIREVVGATNITYFFSVPQIRV